MTKSLDLKLDSDEDHPRRLVTFPDGNILAYGGDDGTLSCINIANNNDEVRIIRQFDEAAVRAVAVSSDGTRVAIGFDNGSTRLYQYDNYKITTDNDTITRHPFIPAPKASSDNNEEDDEDHDNNGFLSQPDRDEDDDDDLDGTWAGPQVEGLIRDLKFLPDSYWLAVASESGLTVVNVSSSETVTDRYVETQAEKEHDGSGVRGVSITNDKEQLMASVAMDGRLCIWKVGGVDKLENASAKVPCVREDQCCVPIKDIGETTGADSSDRSCLPHWVKPGVLALPGKAQLQLREVTFLNDSIVTEETKDAPNSDPSKGHIDSIVSLTSQGDFIVSSGRDRRVILWQLDADEVSLSMFLLRKL